MHQRFLSTVTLCRKPEHAEKMARSSLWIPLLVLVSLASCSCQDQESRLGQGFRLPQGDVELGRAAFVQLDCHQCHRVAGVTLPEPAAPSPAEFTLGGEVRRVKSYGELVTAIIQPQHIVSPEYLAKFPEEQRKSQNSPMPPANDRMTVTQLTHIVTFLHSHYQKSPPAGTTYPYYAP